MRLAKRCEGQKDAKGKKMGRTKRCEWQKVASFITRQNEKKGVCHPIHKSEKSDLKSIDYSRIDRRFFFCILF